MTIPNYLTMRIVLNSGELLTYEQNSRGNISQIMEALTAPHRLFAASHLFIGGPDALVAYRSDSISRIDFIVDLLPELPYLNDAKVVRDVSKYTFDQHYEQNYYKAERVKAAEKAGSKQVGFVRIELAAVGTLYWEVIMESANLLPIDVASVVNVLVTSHGLLAELEDSSGVMVINPANVSSIAFLPGPPIFPTKAWRLNKIGETRPL